jgi:hypothetical protein
MIMIVTSSLILQTIGPVLGEHLITSNQDYPIILRNGDSEKVFEVTKEGKIFAREVEVTIDGIPDYVFEEGYNLMNIEDLRIFIEENKHLPNVPSAEDVQKNGLGIGEFQRIQLEKIEELTLYIIQLNEELEKVKRENLILMQKISKLENQ